MTHSASLVAVRAAEGGVLLFRVYADGNYWAGAGWEDDAVSDIDAGERRGQGFFAGHACGRGQSAGTAARGTRQVVQPQEDYVRHGAVCGPGRDAEGTHAGRVGFAARRGYD